MLAESTEDTSDETTIVTNVSDEELLAAVGEMISGSAKRGANDAPVPMTPAEKDSLETAPPSSTPEDEGSPDPCDVVSLGGKPAEISGGTATSRPTAQALNFREELDILTGSPSIEKAVEPAASTFPESAPAARDRQQQKRRWAVVSVVVIALGLSGLAIWKSTSSDSSSRQQLPAPHAGAVTAGIVDKTTSDDSKPRMETAPVPDVSAPLPGSSPTSSVDSPDMRSSLPRFIPPQSLVREYSEKNPGWERYVTPEYEFRLFRKSNEIKALQVIDRTGRGMSRSFFTRTILEMANVRDYRLRSKETKGDYLIKRGTLSGNAGVILYKKRDDTQLRAFVIHFR